MPAFLGFLIVVSCSDGFADCLPAQPPRAFPTMTACETQLNGAFSTSKQRETLLARCLAAPRAKRPANDNVPLGGKAAAFGRFAWQVSGQGDLLAQMLPANDNAAPAADGAENAPPQTGFYAENIYSSGRQTIAYSAALTAAAAQDADTAALQTAGKHGTLLTLYGTYHGKKPARSTGGKNRALPPQADSVPVEIAGYGAKYIYETNSFDADSAYRWAGMNIVWGSLLPLSEARFAIEPQAERVYAMDSREAAVLRRSAEAAPMLPAQDYFREDAPQQDIFYQNLPLKPNLGDTAQAGGGQSGLAEENHGRPKTGRARFIS